ncbi:MAG: glycosyltransferase family 2 protein [Prolixibacteraceae bacterium]|nr:glycosyltransferase family 2 protein [Prolixibacteraceae bacterium]
MDKLAVIVVNWNGLTDTVECMESVLKQTFSGFQVFLIDNGSENNEFEELTKRYGANPNVELIQNTTNLGFGKAHNLIFEQLIQKGFQKVALLNNDAVAHPDWLKQACKTMDETNAGIVASKMVNYHNRDLLDSAGLFMLNTGEILPRGHKQAANKFNRCEPVISFCAGACLIQLDVIGEIGGFDDFFDTGYEDAELGLRATVAGKKIVYEPNSVVYHKMGQSLSKVTSYQRTRKIMQDVRYTYFKLMPWPVIALNAPFCIVRTAFILLLHLLTLRLRYPALFFDAWFQFLLHDIKNITNSAFTIKQKISTMQIIAMQKFFLKTDFSRFIAYFVKGKPTKFETK